MTSPTGGHRTGSGSPSTTDVRHDEPAGGAGSPRTAHPREARPEQVGWQPLDELRSALARFTRSSSPGVGRVSTTPRATLHARQAGWSREARLHQPCQCCPLACQAPAGQAFSGKQLLQQPTGVQASMPDTGWRAPELRSLPTVGCMGRSAAPWRLAAPTTAAKAAMTSSPSEATLPRYT